MDFTLARKNCDRSRGNFAKPQQVIFTSRQAAGDSLLLFKKKNIQRKNSCSAAGGRAGSPTV